MNTNIISIVNLTTAELQELIQTAIAAEMSKIPYPSLAGENKVLTRKEAAEYLSITPNTLSRYVKKGRIKACGTEKRYFFLPEELLSFLTDRK